MTVTAATDRRDVGAQRWGPPRRVTLKRTPGVPLGISIVGGKVDIISKQDATKEGQEKAIFGIFIKNVVPNSPAGKSGALKTGDRILEVDGSCVRNAQHERAVQLIKAAGDTVTLTVQSLEAWNTDSSDVDGSTPSPTKKRKAPTAPATTQNANSATTNATSNATANAAANANATANSKAPASKGPESDVKISVSEPEKKEKGSAEAANQQKETAAEPPKQTIYSSDSESESEDERNLGGRLYTEAGVEIDRASAGAVRRSREEREADPEEEDDFGYTTNKIKKKYASFGDNVVVVKLERVPKWGLGLSLAGHRDRNRMAAFVCGLHPEGAAVKASPPIKVGDEILEVNGIVLHGRCHLNASAIIKGLMGPVFKFIFLRRSEEALEDVAVKPLSQFPSAIDDDADDRFVNYKNVRDLVIKKGQGGLGIMIIEGRHAEAGRGIFVSDLQEGSVAEMAGINIGDMLLAVNKESLLECNYDAAAAKLKQTEGIVTLTISTPNVKPDEKPGDAVTAEATADGPTKEKPAPAPAKAEPPPDPSVAPIASNADTVIEINSNNELLGVVLLGGSDTLINGPAAIILDIYKNGAIGKDGRLKVGDQIKDCNGIAITKEMSHDRICMSIKQKAAKLKMTIHRDDPIVYDEVEVELTKKGGRPLGITCVQPVSAPGVYLGDHLAGSPAEVDGKLQKGDFLVAVDGKDLSSADLTAAATALKLAGNKTTIKVKRFKIR